MFPFGKQRHRKALAVCVLLVSAAVAAPALAAFESLSVFGQPGAGAGRVGPKAPAIAVNAGGRVYVADISDDRIEAFSNHGTPDGGWGGLQGPAGVAAAPDGSVVVSDRSGVYRYNAGGARIATLAAAGGSVGAPAGVAVGDDGTVYVADPARGQVVALPGGARGGFDKPIAVAIAPDQRLYVVDDGDDRIHVFAADGSPAGSWRAHDPGGVAVAPDGSVLVTEIHGHRVLRFTADGAPLGEFGRSAGPRKLNVPRGVATDCRGRAYVVDNSAPRIHVFGHPGPPPPCVEPPPPPPPPPPPAPMVAASPEPEPVLGKTARATTVAGVVLVGSRGRLRELRGREILPLGTTIDSSDGRVRLEFETAPGSDRRAFGRLMEGEFYDGTFRMSQGTKSSLVELRLRDDDEGGLRVLATRSSAAQRKKKRLEVWGKARGRFRTVGRNGAATVRGTQWLTSERTDGTLFRVLEGIVQVREFASRRLVTLTAGEQFLARPPCVSRRAFQIRLRVPPGDGVRRAVVTVRGKRVPIRRGSRVTAPVDLRGTPGGRVTVRIRVRTTSGRLLTGTRTYFTCTNTQRIPRQLPEL